ncbi:MAG: pilus assembly protein [Rhizobiales bacterium]|nr:pilus assembly protein [Hyphomicrobiales bacterium]
MNQPRKSVSSIPNFLGRFRRANKGVTAIEFAMLALPFFALLSMIIESSVIFVSTSSLESATTQASRLIRTGQVKASNMTAAQFTTKICDNLMLVQNCTSTLKVDVRNFSTFGGATFPALVDADGNVTNTVVYQPGSAGDIVVVRAFYAWSIMSPLSLGLNNVSGNKFLVNSNVAFRNEPF